MNSRKTLAILVLALAANPGYTQIKIVADYHGSKSRVVAMARDNPIVIGNTGKKAIADIKTASFELDDRFAEGRVEIAYETDQPKMNGARRKLDRLGPYWRTDALVTADRDLQDCFLVYAFSSDGVAATFVTNIGNLKANATQRVLIDIGRKLDAPGISHILSQGREVPSNGAGEPGQTLAQQVATTQNDEAGETMRELRTRNDQLWLLSPDGALIARLEWSGSGSVLTLLESNSGSELFSTQIDPESKDFQVLRWNSLHWVSPELLVIKRSHKLYRVNVTTGVVTAMLDRVRHIPLFGYPDPSSILVERSEGLHNYLEFDFPDGASFFEVLNVATGVSAEAPPLLSNLPKPIFYKDRNGEPRFASSWKDQSYRYYTRNAGDSDWTPLEDINQEPGLQSFIVAGPKNAGEQLRFLGFADEDDEAYFSTNYDSDRREIVRYNFRAGRVSKKVARNGFYDVSSRSDNGGPLIIDTATRELLGLAYQADLPRVTLFDDRLKAALAIIDTAYDGVTNVPVEWSGDFKRVHFRTFSDQCRSFDSLVDVDAKKISPLDPLPDPEALAARGKTLIRRFAARDGHMLDAYATYPQDNYNRPLPIVALPFDHLASRARGDLDPLSQYFASRGYIALRVNSRGCPGYGKAHYQAGAEGRLDGYLIDDLADGVKATIADGEARADQVFVVGIKMGGYTALMSLIKYPDLYAAGVSAFGYEDLLKEFDDDRYLPTGIENHLARLKNDREYRRAACPALRADEISAPLLIIKDSTRYNRVVAVSSKVYARLKKKGVPCQLEGFAQNDTYRAIETTQSALLYSHIEAFIAQYTQPEPQRELSQQSPPSRRIGFRPQSMPNDPFTKALD